MPTHSSTTGGAGFSSLSQDMVLSNYTVTTDMIDALNLTTFKYFFDAYCVVVPNDGCPYGYCPNPDIAGIFVRVATYVTNFFVAIILFHNRKGVKGAVWSQILWVYSLLLTSAWTALRHHITRIHATLAFFMAASPVTLYIYFYALLSIFKRKHRLDAVIGPGQILARLTILLSMALMVVGLAAIVMPPESTSRILAFQQRACEPEGTITNYFFLIPLLSFRRLPEGPKIILISVLAATGVLLILAWLYAFFRRFRGREKNPGTNISDNSKEPTSTWATMRDRYKLLHLTTLVILPTSIWIMFIELGIHFGTPHDNQLQTSFGQVLAMFVAIPPILTTVKKTPRVKAWYRNLFLVRRYRSRKTEPVLPIHQHSSSSSTVDTVVEKNHDDSTLTWKERDLPEIRIIPFDSSLFDISKESAPSHPKDIR